jgi:hypothetical protein
MSTETAATPRARAAARRTAITSSKVRTFVIVFSLTAPVMYVLCDLLGLPLFTFHPATGRVEWGYALPRRGEGPVMYWYGWTVTTLLISAAAGLLATFLPENATRRIPLFLLWLLPLVAIPILVWSLMPFWTK